MRSRARSADGNDVAAFHASNPCRALPGSHENGSVIQHPSPSAVRPFGKIALRSMEPPSTVTVHVFNPTGVHVDGDLIVRACQHALRTNPTLAGRLLEVVLVEDEEMRRLNRDLRGVDSSTDVLTFPAPAFPHAPLGEIVISLPWAQRQSSARQIGLDDELAYLAIHGCLHLLGMDDQTPEEQESMFAAMHRIGLELGLPEQREWHSFHPTEASA